MVWGGLAVTYTVTGGQNMGSFIALAKVDWMEGEVANMGKGQGGGGGNGGGGASTLMSVSELIVLLFV